MGAIVVGSINLWASNDVTNSQVDNAAALNEHFFIVCGKGDTKCSFTCPNCGQEYKGGLGKLGNHGGNCEICGFFVQYN